MFRFISHAFIGSTKYYQKKNQDFKKRLVKGIKLFIKKKKKELQYGHKRYKNYYKPEKGLVQYRKNLSLNVEKRFAIMFRRI